MCHGEAIAGVSKVRAERGGRASGTCQLCQEP